MKGLWRLWAKALGEKASENDSEADLIAWIRTIIVIISIVTNLFTLSQHKNVARMKQIKSRTGKPYWFSYKLIRHY